MKEDKIFLPKYITGEYRKLLKLIRLSAHTIDVKQIRLAFLHLQMRLVKNIIKILTNH